MLVCTPPDAMDAREAPVEVKLRLPPLMQLTEREQFCKGLVDLKHELLGFGVKSKDSKQVRALLHALCVSGSKPRE